MQRHKTINPEKDFICLDDYVSTYPIDIDLVYAKLDHPDNHFKIGAKEEPKTPLYNSTDPKLWVHKALGEIVLDAARYLNKLDKNYSLSLKDSFRPGDAQHGMSFCRDKNGEPYPSTLVSQPGQGAHPVAMAIDIMLKKNGVEVEAGTRFDHFDVDRVKRGLPPESSRVYELSDAEKADPEILRKASAAKANQKILEKAMMKAALDKDLLIMPLEDEHWDFRFPTNHASLWYVLKSVARIVDADMPPEPEKPIQSYAEFEQNWKKLFLDNTAVAARLQSELGHLSPPPADKVIYSGEYYPLLDEQVPDRMKMTDGKFAFAVKEIFKDKGLIPPQLRKPDIGIDAS